ncbi:MAG TPA: hypothetical protein VFQ60_05355, partial [Patescibacteria group bacterium]|nr:hypothetical protein [Patescibacteria group bacterium]
MKKSKWLSDRLKPVAIFRALFIFILILVGACIAADLFRKAFIRPLPTVAARVFAPAPVVQAATTEPPVQASRLSVQSLANFPDALKRAGLPVGDITMHLISGATGTAVLIPQIHRSPGSAIADPQNDIAEITQGQIYQIIPYLVNYFSSPLVMLEGDLAGDISPSYIRVLQEKNAAKQSLIRERALLAAEISKNGKSTAAQNAALRMLDQGIAEATRTLLLEGGAYALAAEGYPLQLVGAEDQKTMEAGANIVRAYVYLQDRLAQTDPRESSVAVNADSGSGLPTNVSALLSMLAQSQSVSSGIDQVLSRAMQSKDSQTANHLVAAKQAMAQIEAPMPEKFAAAPAPSRADNPYQSIHDKKTLNELMKKTEGQIQTVVIDERNEQTADHFVHALMDKKQSVGVIQYGAGHE